MDQSRKTDERTPEQKHHEQLLLEIWLPLGVVIAVCAGLAILAVVLADGSMGVISQWADISMIAMIVPILVLSLGLVILLFYLDHLMIGWNKSLPDFFILLRKWVDSFAGKVQKIAAMIAHPIVFIKSMFAGLQSLSNKIPLQKK